MSDELRQAAFNSSLITHHSSLALSCVLDDDALDDVGGALAAVNGGFELLVNFLPLDDVERVGRALEKFRERLVIEVVALVLKPVDFDEARVDAGGAFEGGDYFVEWHGPARY